MKSAALTVLVLAMVSSIASECRAITDARTIAYFIDCTPSVAGGVELRDVTCYVATSLPNILALDSLATTLELYSWTGEPLSSRVASRRWELPSIPSVDHGSLFRRRQEYLRGLALRRRELVVADATQAITTAGVEAAARSRQSCVWSMLEDALASRALCIVVTDAFDEGCHGATPSPRGDRRVLVVVIARRADGASAQVAVAKRVRRLRALGFNAVDARELRSLDWATLLGSQSGSSLETGRN